MPVELEIVSPEKLLLSKSVEMVVIPAYEGEMGVLPGHSPMIVLLRGGTIQLYENNQVTERLFVSGGFAEVTAERVTVLATEAIPIPDVSRTEGERRLAIADSDYTTAPKDDVDSQEAALDRMQSARAMIETASN